MTTFSRSASPMITDLAHTPLDLLPQMSPSLLGPLTRSASVSSLHALSGLSVTPTYPEKSAKHHLRKVDLTLACNSPPLPPGEKKKFFLACSRSDKLIFTRDRSILIKPFATHTVNDVTELFSFPENRSGFRAIACGGIDQSADVVAVATMKGGTQVLDLTTGKSILHWLSLKNVTAMAWNGCVLTVGSERGTIAHYDTRVKGPEKMKEQAVKAFRHQAAITSIAWNDTGRFMASGDESGCVLVWENGLQRPLEIGEETQRRKRIQHDSRVVVSRRSVVFLLFPLPFSDLARTIYVYRPLPLVYAIPRHSPLPKQMVLFASGTSTFKNLRQTPCPHPVLKPAQHSQASTSASNVPRCSPSTANSSPRVLPLLVSGPLSLGTGSPHCLLPITRTLSWFTLFLACVMCGRRDSPRQEMRWGGRIRVIDRGVTQVTCPLARA